VALALIMASCSSNGSGATTLWAGTGDSAHQVASGTLDEMLAKASAMAGFELKLPKYIPAGTHVSNINLVGGAADNPNTHGSVAVIHINGSHGSYYLAEFKGVLTTPKGETWGPPPPGLSSAGAKGCTPSQTGCSFRWERARRRTPSWGLHRSYTIEADADGSRAVELPKMVKSLVAD
jgi:hypothetical protein